MTHKFYWVKECPNCAFAIDLDKHEPNDNSQVQCPDCGVTVYIPYDGEFY